MPELPFRNRVIRVFVSSTFRDMQEDRDYLVKFTFPRLRKLCEARGVTWGEVDLRWGITEEEASQGQVLPLILEEIRRCRPYFIGLLGERYGWVPRPDEIPDDLLQRQPWLNDHLTRSVTELEVIHGVLGSTPKNGHAFFYFRDASYLERIPSDRHLVDFKSETPQAQERLTQLKNRLRAASAEHACQLRENYHDPEELGKWILEDFSKLIDQLFPEPDQPGLLDREARLHEAFAHTRTRVYVERQDYLDRLDEHAAGTGPPLIILGESGSGKSALLANWVKIYRQSQPTEFVLSHFVGASADSADWAAMLRRIMYELKRVFEITHDVPDKPDELISAFANWLQMASAQAGKMHRRVVLLIDALNQLEDRQGAPDLVWLPPVLPDNVRLIVSTLEGRPLNELARRGWPILTIQPLTTGERIALTHDYLRQYTKQLSDEQMRRIADCPQAANPLYLCALLEELRVFGIHERLDERIAHYLQAATIPQLYEQLLERCEKDYDRDCPGLVRDAMSLVWASRRGLTEAEILDMLGRDGTPLPRARWSPLFLAAEHSMVNHDGLIGFYHDYLRQAVQNKYLPNEAARNQAHLALADYFEARQSGSRRGEELPWQLAQAGSWQRLYDLLTDSSYLEAAWESNQLDVRGFWARIEANSALRVVDGYRGAIEDPSRFRIKTIAAIASLMTRTGHSNEAAELLDYLIQRHRRTGDRASLAACQGNLALIRVDRGDLDGALALHREEEQICRELGDEEGLLRSRENQAHLLTIHGDWDGALVRYQEGERIARGSRNQRALSTSLGNQALIHRKRGKLDRAMTLHKEEEQLCRELEDLEGLSTSMGNQALVLMDRGELNAAAELLEQTRHISEKLGSRDGLRVCLGNQAIILARRGELDRAMELHKQEEQIALELDHKDGLRLALSNQAFILAKCGLFADAMERHKECEQICRELRNKQGLASSLNNQGTLHAELGEFASASELHGQAEALYRQLGDKEGLANTLTNQGVNAMIRGTLEAAMELHQEAEQLYRQAENKGGLASSLANQAQILAEQRSFNAATKLHREAEQLFRELGNKHGLATLLLNQAEILRQTSRKRDALKMFKEAEQLCRDVEDCKNLAIALANQAVILAYDWGIDRPREALPLIEEACQLAKQHGYNSLAERMEEDVRKIRIMAR